MGINGTEFARISGSYSTAFIGSWALLSQNTSANTSTIRLYGTFYYGGGTKVSSSVSGGYFEVNGTTVKSGSYTYYPGYTQLGYKDITVTHNSDGSFPQTSVSIAAYSYHISAATKSATIAAGAVKAIPRASTVSATSATCGSTSTITVTPADSSFNHILYYSMGSISWSHIVSLSAGTKSYSWTIPTDVEKQITSSTTGTVTVICETYNSSGNLLGSKSCNITATVRSSVVPTITGLTGAEAATIMTAKGWGVYVQNKSQIKLTASGVGGSQGSSITKIAFSGASQSSSGTSTTWTTSQITVSGSQTFTCTVTDSRGRTASKTLSVTIYAYTAPVLKTFSAVRANSSGTATDSGTAVLVKSTITAAATCNSKNSTTRKVYYKLASATSWSSLATLTSDSQTITSVTFSADSTYDLKIEVADGFNTIVQTAQLATSYSMIEFRSTKKGIAIGKASEYDMFEVNMAEKHYKAETHTGATTFSGPLTASGTLTANVYNGGQSGTWTPVAYGGGSFSTANGVYYKIGKLVWVKAYIAISSTFTSSDPVYFKGLPFTPSQEAALTQVYGNLTAYTSANKGETMDGYAGWFVYPNGEAYVKASKYGRIWGQSWNTIGTGDAVFAGCYLTDE